MNLDKYASKRNFEESHEPKSKVAQSGDKNIFVVQKHAASHLHFDFRMEADGVLKSWAVPKEPSLNPEDKRLAVMVEDHPLDYANFEGTIPEGHYGAGTVEIWDKGTYEPFEGFEDVATALDKGKLEFNLFGSRLRGGFLLLRTKGNKVKNGWLLIKKEDGYSTADHYDTYNL